MTTMKRLMTPSETLTDADTDVRCAITGVWCSIQCWPYDGQAENFIYDSQDAVRTGSNVQLFIHDPMSA